jgi:hypothetical protein
MIEPSPQSSSDQYSFTEALDCITLVIAGPGDTTIRPARAVLLRDPPPPRRPPIPDRPENGENPPTS